MSSLPRRSPSTAQETIERNREAQVAVFGEDLGRLINLIALRLRLRQSAIASIVGLSQPMISQLATGTRGLPQSEDAIESIRLLGDLARAVDEDPSIFEDVMTRVEELHAAAVDSTAARGASIRRLRRSGAFDRTSTEGGDRELSLGYDKAALTLFQVLTYLGDRNQLAEAAERLVPVAPELARILERAAVGSSKEFVAEFRHPGTLMP
jgi:predicted transcriptional regulator